VPVGFFGYARRVGFEVFEKKDLYLFSWEQIEVSFELFGEKSAFEKAWNFLDGFFKGHMLGDASVEGAVKPVSGIDHVEGIAEDGHEARIGKCVVNALGGFVVKKVAWTVFGADFAGDLSRPE